MALIKSVRGHSPSFDESCWLAENATVVGDVIMGENCTVWFNAVIRGDVNSIRIGHHTNVQDGAVIHCTYQRFATTVGNYVSIAHNAIEGSTRIRPQLCESLPDLRPGFHHRPAPAPTRTPNPNPQPLAAGISNELE